VAVGAVVGVGGAVVSVGGTAVVGAGVMVAVAGASVTTSGPGDGLQAEIIKIRSMIETARFNIICSPVFFLVDLISFEYAVIVILLPGEKCSIRRRR